MPRFKRLLFALLLAGAFVLRVAYNTYLLPPVFTYPNEVGKRDTALELLKTGFDHGSSMPSFLLNSLFLLYYPVRWVYQFGHRFFPGFGPFGMSLDVFYLWFGRGYMALFGTATVGLVFLLGRRLHSEAAGWMASLALAVAPIAVLGSRHMKEDMPLGLLATLAMIFFVDVIQRGRRTDSKTSGFATGMCLSTKWTGGLLLIPLIAAHWMRAKSANDDSGIATKPCRLRWALLFVLVGFFVLSPDFLFRPDTLYKGLRRAVKKSYTEHSDGMKVSPFDEAMTDYFRTGLWPGLTPALLAFSVMGWGGLLKRRPGDAWLVGGWVAFHYALLETATARPYPHFQRYLQTTIPCFATLAGCGIVFVGEAARRLPGVGRRVTPKAAVTIVALFALAWPLHDTLRYLYYIPRSTIYECYDYMKANVPAGSLIIPDGYGPDCADMNYRFGDLRDKDRLNVGPFPPGPCYVMMTTYGMGRFLEHPDANPEIAQYVYYVLGVGHLEAEWKPGFRSFYCESPRIRLFYFDGTEPAFQAHVGEVGRDGQD
ncbi:MAG: glycosyltransferase family 39 protein [Candidatus Sumerlaeota bacterium]|nr:glycosyltransferase family 39 protein [Candidatus Sumerlaeota bacterium]